MRAKTFSKIFAKIKNFALDILFPISCLVCGKEDVWICDECLERIPLRATQVCPQCEKNITPQGQICFPCRDKYSIDGLLLTSFYSKEVIAKMVHLYKYRFAEDLHIPLGKLMIKAILQAEIPLPDYIIPIPLHPRRLRWRGFNQAQLLADYLSANLTPGLPIPVSNNVLFRQKYTHPQMQIKNYAQRQKNMAEAFAIDKKNKKMIAGKNILLVDDIATTGSTLFECARILKKAGAASVFGIVIARQEFKKKPIKKSDTKISFFPH